MDEEKKILIANSVLLPTNRNGYNYFFISGPGDESNEIVGWLANNGTKYKVEDRRIFINCKNPGKIGRELANIKRGVKMHENDRDNLNRLQSLAGINEVVTSEISNIAGDIKTTLAGNEAKFSNVTVLDDSASLAIEFEYNGRIYQMDLTEIKND